MRGGRLLRKTQSEVLKRLHVIRIDHYWYLDGFQALLEPASPRFPAGEEPEEVEDYTLLNLQLLEEHKAEMEAKLAAYGSAHSPESTDPPPDEEQPESVGAAQADSPTLSQPRVELGVAPVQTCTPKHSTDRAPSVVPPAGDSHHHVCCVPQQGIPAASSHIDCHSHSLPYDQLDQQQQQRSSCSEPACTYSFFRRLGGTPKTEQVILTGKAWASPVVDKSNFLAGAQFQHSVSFPKNHVALTADASVQHGGQSGSRPSTAVTPIVGSLLSQAAFPVATAQHPVYSCTPPSLLWHTPAEDARGSSAMTVTDAPQLPGETGQPSPESQKVSEERAESAGVQPTFAHDAQEQHIDPPSNR